MLIDPELIKEVIYKDDGRYLIYFSTKKKNEPENNESEIDENV